MPLSFPSNPTLGQTYISGSSNYYQWNGSYWGVVQPPIFATVAASASISASRNPNPSRVSLSSSISPSASFALSRIATESTWNYNQDITTQGGALSGNATQPGGDSGVFLTPSSVGQFGRYAVTLNNFNWNRDFRVTSQFFVTDRGTSTGDYMNIVMGAPSALFDRTASGLGLSVSFDDYDLFSTGRGFTVWRNNTLIANTLASSFSTPMIGEWYNAKIEVRTNSSGNRNLFLWYNTTMVLACSLAWTPSGNVFGLSASTGAAFAAHQFRYLTLEYI